MKCLPVKAPLGKQKQRKKFNDLNNLSFFYVVRKTEINLVKKLFFFFRQFDNYIDKA